MRQFLAFFSILIMASGVTAQDVPCVIQGSVVDDHGHALTGAVVQQFETTNGVVCNNSGGFSLIIPCNHPVRLVVSFIGFGTMDTVIQHPSKTKKLQLVLETASAYLHQLVVEDQRHQEHASIAHDELDQAALLENSQGTLIKSLEAIPGVQSINVGVGISKPVLRGLSMNRVVVNQNGVRQEGQQWGSDHGLEVDPFNPEKVEVVKGPSTLRFGSGSAAGVINLLPASIAPLDTVMGDFSAIYKSNNNHVGASGSVKWNRKNWFGIVRLSGQEFGDYEVPADSFVYNSYELPIIDQTLVNTAGKERALSAELGKTAHWGTSRLTYSFYGLQAGLFPGAMGIPRSYNIQPDGNTRNIDLPYQDVQHHKLTSLSDVMFKNNKTQLQLIFSGQQNLRKEFAEPHAHGSVLTDSLALDLELTTLSAQASLKHHQNDKLRHEGGLQLTVQDNAVAGFEFLIPNYFASETGLYYVLDYELNSKTKLSAGGRVGHFFLQNETAVVFGTADANADGTAIRSNALEKQLVNWSAAFGLNRQLTKTQHLRFDLNKSFRNPSIAELASNGIHHGTFRHEKGNPNIGQEQGYHVDLGWEWRRNGLLIDVAGFSSLYSDFIYLKPTAFFSPLPEGGQLFEYTQNDAVFSGGELKFDWQINERWANRFSGDVVWNQNLETQLPLPFTPPARLQNELRYRLPWNKGKLIWEAVAGYKYTFAQNRTDRNEPETPAYQLLHAGCNFTFNTKALGAIRLTATVQNLLDTPYFNHLSRYRYLNIPEQGRNVVVGLTVPFGS